MIPLLNLQRMHKPIEDEIKEVVNKVIDSGRYCIGPNVVEFERELAQYVGVKYAVGVNSGSAALNLSLLSLNVGLGDNVIVPVNTYVATAFSVSHCRADVRFVDHDKYYTIDVDKIEEKLDNRTKAVIPVHLYGQPVDMSKLMKLKQKYGFFILEDSAQALGAKFAGNSVCSFGDVACVSFYPGKNLGAIGDAGAVLTNDKRIYKKVLEFRNDGRREEKYIHYSVGWNERLDEIQAAVLRVKLRYLNNWNLSRNRIANLYSHLLYKSDIVLPEIRPRTNHVFHQYVTRVKNRNFVLRYLKENGVGAGIHYPIPIHKQPAYKQHCNEKYPLAEECCGRLLSLPMCPTLTDAEVEKVVFLLKKSIDKSEDYN